MEDKYKDFVCYIPVHANYSQVESISPFIENIRTKVFVYPWNTDGEKMADYFSKLKVNKSVDVQVMNELNIMKEVWAEPDGTKIIILLTSSKTYSFGLAQWKFFRAVQEVFPYKVKDVFTVGHCMYGCDSCSVSEHRFPLFFSRYIKNTLPFNSEYVRKKYIGQHKDPQLKTVLICPSVQEKSFLNNAEIINQLIELKSRAPFNDPKKYRFLLKLHAHCFFTEKHGRVHPLHDVTKEEHQHAEVLKSVFELVPEEEFNILPFLEQFDIILTDLDSSVPFESLYFANKSILAFQQVNAVQYHDTYNVEKDEKYLQLLNLFKNSDELLSYLTGTLPLKKTDESARQFFTSIYGTPDGTEVDKVAAARDWFGAMPPPPELEQDLIAATNEVTVLLDKLFVNPLPTDYLARGLDIPAEAVAFTVFVANHKSQLDFYNIPQALWRPLFNKLRQEIFDAGSAFQFAMGEDDADSAHPKLFLVATRSLQPQEDIFLIDHAWTTTPKQAKEQLAAHPQLLQRMEDILDIVPESEDQKTRIEKVVETMWYSAKSYRVTDPNGGEILVWYVIDELGSRINHSDEPNMRCTNFLYLDNQTAYSLIWPETAIEEGELITRDYVHGTTTELEREAKLYVLSEHFAQRGVDIDTDEVKSKLINAFQAHKTTLLTKAEKVKKSLDLTREPKMHPESKKPELGRKLKVFADTDLVNNFLKYDKFEIVHDPTEADILWYQTKDIGNMDHLKNALGKQSDAPLMVNQYPNENAITYKHLLVETLEDYFGDLCHEWISPSYDLDKLLPQFAGHFLDREDTVSQKNNVWIVKPWNLARGIEITVSRNLMEIIRLAESGPKLASIYINPTLYNKRKFDLRYIVMVRSLEPLEVYLFKMFWIRLANVEYSLDEFDNYEKHFTVMNYSRFQMTQLLYTDFIKSFEEQYPNTPWNTVQSKINKAIYHSVLAAVPKIKNAQSKFDVNQCSGMYGVDVMVDSEMNAKVLEINFGPDCTRACNYDPEFYNVLFAVMFTNDWYQNPIITERVVPI